MQEQRLVRVFIQHAVFQLLTFLRVVVKDKRASRASHPGRVVSATRSHGVPSPVPVAYHAGKGLKTLNPATTSLLAGRYCTVLRALWQIKSR